ncbi:maltooligosyl trehalose synthase [Azotobacter vinelandii CA]|uniref:Malto-oligosyltrehalose synthase n=2 Tax=Azotobacter vinelandii TaxID=354 RepID=C1DIJ1_AZOVD|nr:malto-oligosyltrehalose synthase [Azotobacter vinelandii]ACO78672.1 malto-oligosyltrehalose synthase [Azotobacter vinelandii DJ]AGK14045.1 maltooligosyl trehalose synthase [Azotobacter vinelandii CA]AGK18893.1 maltooligosyl trehalose synthase [Azotobacter vinelandii CA6]SFY05188.1 maltooligosyl trehalose synthase [Azotobacter vinelandii]GLK62411.1 malto-oligosyltrehalose synthase [Azotobacter vinelandii]
MSGPRATLRLQFHSDFTLDDAVPLVDYFADLGISHLYASPLLTARPGSRHGYDVIDPTRINPELGGEPALRRLVEALRSHGMGLILDIVSNHMAVGGAGNPWWLDVLEWGRRSPYAAFFDIQWNSPDPLLEGQLLVPFLRSDYGEVLQGGEIPLRFDAQAGVFYASHHEHRFPIGPPSYGELLGASDHPALRELAAQFDALAGEGGYRRAAELKARLSRLAARPAVRIAIEALLAAYDARQPQGFARLHALFERQFYRLASWRTAADDINWRRFFDINELGGLRVERPRVFEATHAKIFQLFEEGLIDGLRIDHIDGLADPHGYCRRLRRRLERLGRGRRRPIYVEKILGQGEELHGDWLVDGTTGYEFMNQVSLLQHAPDGAGPLRVLWHSLGGRPADFLEEVRQARRLVLTGTLAGDFESAAQALLQVARGDLMTRDITFGQIRRALLELIVHFPVYRTYIGACGRPAQDEPFFRQALEGARDGLDEADWPLLAHLDRWLGGEPWRRLPPGPRRKARRHACVRFQQVTAPTAAKAVEDTALYRSGVLLSRNDVGFDSQCFAAPPEDFHTACLRRRERFPDSLLASATHDHKRGEDSRARLAVLSERAGWYGERLQRWLLLAQPLRRSHGDGPAPLPVDELMLYQTLLGSWPPDLAPDDEAGMRAYAGRLRQWQEKALREAKLNSAWSAPNAPYEAACRAFLDDLLENPVGVRLREEIAAAAAAIAPAGALNSLAQTLLRMTVPGVPDLYQGNEFWDFSLVDPDNRRPVDFAARRQALAQGREPAELIGHWRDGRLKQALIARTLALRARCPALFSAGDYLPLKVVGEQRARLLAFARRHAGQWALILAPRLAGDLLGEAERPAIEPARWTDTRVLLPEIPALRGVLSGETVPRGKSELFVGEALATFPVGLFHGA